VHKSNNIENVLEGVNSFHYLSSSNRSSCVMLVLLIIDLNRLLWFACVVPMFRADILQTLLAHATLLCTSIWGNAKMNCHDALLRHQKMV